MHAFFALDWFPDGHKPMPQVISLGRKPNFRPCGVCHRPEGVGGPENASLAGLPEDYIIRQVEDYRSGARSTAVKERAHVFRMITGLKTPSAKEIKHDAERLRVINDGLAKLRSDGTLRAVLEKYGQPI